MPALDREPRPWPSPSSHASTARAHPSTVFPSLKRVRGNRGAGESMSKAEGTQNTHPRQKTSESSLISPDDLFIDDSPPLQQMSVLRDASNQSFTRNNPPSRVEDQTTVAKQRQDGQPLFPSHPRPPPSSPIPKPKFDISSKLLMHNATPPLTVKASKVESAERSRQARSHEDNRLVHDARKSAAELIQRTRTARVEARANREATSSQDKGIVRRERKAETTAAPRASGTKERYPMRSLSPEKKTSSSTERGRALEREMPRRRNLVMTDSPKPHVGGKISIGTKSTARTTASSMKAKSATVSSRLHSSPKSATGVTPRATVASSKAKLPQKHSGILTSETRSLKSTRARKVEERVEKKREVRKSAMISPTRDRASAPSPEELIVVTDGQKAVLEPEHTTTNKPLYSDPSSAEAMLHSSVDPQGSEEKHTKEMQEAASMSKPAKDWTSRGNSSSPSPIAAVHRPKTRRPPTRPRPDSPQPVGPEKLVNELSEKFLHVEEQTNNARLYKIATEALSRGKAIPFEPSFDDFSAEQMSPVDLSKVSSLHTTSPPQEIKAGLSEWKGTFSTPEYPWNLKKDIGGPLELKSAQAESLRKPLDENPMTDSDLRLDVQIKSLLDFHSKVGANQVPFDSNMTLDKLALGFQNSVDSLRRISPNSKPRHKRKGVKTVQWTADLPIRAKDEIRRRDASGNDGKSTSEMKEKKKTAENHSTGGSYELSGGLLNFSSPAKLQPTSKAPLSCLTNSHRGRKLRVSFEDDLMADFIAAASENEAKVSAQTSSVNSDEANHEEVKASIVQNTSTGDHVALADNIEAVLSAGPQVYQPRHYAKAFEGLHKARETGHLLLESSHVVSSQQHKTDDIAHAPFSSHQIDDAVKYICDVKKRFYSHPMIYSEFVRLLESCRTEPITAEQAKYVDAQVAKLFAGNPDLLQGFKRFRPAEGDPAIIAKGDIVKPVVAHSVIQDDRRGGTQDDSSKEMGKEDTEKHRKAIGQIDSIEGLFASARRSARVNSMDRIVESLRDSARVLGKQPDHKSPVVSASKTGSLKFNPEATEFKPVLHTFLPPGTLPRQPPSYKPASSVHQYCHFRKDMQPSPVYTRVNADGALATGFHTMPAKPNRYFEAMKKDLAAAEKPHPVVLEKPVALNGTTYYTMPKDGFPQSAAKSLPGGFKNDHRKDCRFAFSKPNQLSYRGQFASMPKNPQFKRREEVDPLWMYTPLVPIRKDNAGGEFKAPQAHLEPHHRDASEDHGVEAKRLDEHIAKMKLDDFMSRFPMTGRKAQVVTNMKQKYAAEIQHRLELVLYEKKEKEATARKVSGGAAA